MISKHSVPSAALGSAASLPLKLIEAIRAKTWVSQHQVKLRSLARIVRQAQYLGIDEGELQIVLAGAIMQDQPEGRPWDFNADVRELCALAWQIVSSPQGLTNALLASFGAKVTIDDHLAVAKAHFAEERGKIAMSPADAFTLIEHTVSEVGKTYPQLELSFGYIGNIWHAPYSDDRCFKVFARTPAANCNGSVSFGGHRLDQIGELACLVRKRLPVWAAEQAQIGTPAALVA